MQRNTPSRDSVGKQLSIGTVLIGSCGCVWFLKAIQRLIRRGGTDKVKLFLGSDCSSQLHRRTNVSKSTYRRNGGPFGDASW